MQSIIDSYTKMFVNILRIHFIKVAEISLLTSTILQRHPKTHTNKSSKSVFIYHFRFLQKMKLFATFLLTAMVAIAMEKCTGKYLLVEIEDGK